MYKKLPQPPLYRIIVRYETSLFICGKIVKAARMCATFILRKSFSILVFDKYQLYHNFV